MIDEMQTQDLAVLQQRNAKTAESSEGPVTDKKKK
jgi:hypothetical protein